MLATVRNGITNLFIETAIGSRFLRAVRITEKWGERGMRFQAEVESAGFCLLSAKSAGLLLESKFQEKGMTFPCDLS